MGLFYCIFPLVCNHLNLRQAWFCSHLKSLDSALQKGSLEHFWLSYTVKSSKSTARMFSVSRWDICSFTNGNYIANFIPLATKQKNTLSCTFLIHGYILKSNTVMSHLKVASYHHSSNSDPKLSFYSLHIPQWAGIVCNNSWISFMAWFKGNPLQCYIAL